MGKLIAAFFRKGSEWAASEGLAMDLSFLEQQAGSGGGANLRHGAGFEGVSGISEASIDGAPEGLMMPPGGDVRICLPLSQARPSHTAQRSALPAPFPSPSFCVRTFTRCVRRAPLSNVAEGRHCSIGRALPPPPAPQRCSPVFKQCFNLSKAFAWGRGGGNGRAPAPVLQWEFGCAVRGLICCDGGVCCPP